MLTFVSERKFKKAIENGDVPVLRKILKAKPSYLGLYLRSSSWGGTPLHYAAYHNQPQVIEFLVKEMGVDPCKRDKQMATALHDACCRGSYEAAKVLIELGTDVSVRNNNHRPAADFCDSDRMKQLLREGANYQTKKLAAEKQQQEEAAQWCNFINHISTGNLESLKNILQQYPHFSNLEVQNKDSSSWSGGILHFAAYHNQPQVIEFFVKKIGIDVDKRDRDYLSTALHDACQRNAYEAAQMLIKLGSDIDAKNHKEKAAIDYCSSTPMKELIINAGKTALPPLKIAAADDCLPPSTGGEVWHANGEVEIIRESRLPGSNYKITDIFNFKSRYWKSITKDLSDNSLVQETKFFDELPDKSIIHEAREKFNRDFGGKIESGAVDSRQMRNKLGKSHDL